jgi:hypothetical protein
MIDLALVDIAFTAFCDRARSEFGGGMITGDNLTCCQTCGLAEIESRAAEWEEDAADDRPIGYAFYHEQDTEGCLAGGDLCLSYGVLQEGSATEEQVGHLLTECLRGQGLTVEWDGSVKTRVCVKAEVLAPEPESAP